MLILAARDIRVHLRCTRCGSGRYDRWHAKTGGITGRSYDYAEAYTDQIERDDALLDKAVRAGQLPVERAA